MSEAQIRTALDLTDSVITIIEKSQDTYNAASRAQELSEVFQAISQHTPLVLNILRSCKRAQEQIHLEFTETTDASRRSEIEGTTKAFEPLMLSCQKNAKELQELFGKIDPDDDAADTAEQYSKIDPARTPGKENEALDLMVDLLSALKFVLSRILSTTQDDEQQNENHEKELATAVSQLLELRPSPTKSRIQSYRGIVNRSGSQTHAGSNYGYEVIGRFGGSTVDHLNRPEKAGNQSINSMDKHNGDFSFGTSKD